MSNIKKLLALVLALTMVLSVSAFAGYTVAPYGDAAKVDEDCEVAVQLLYSLDIMKGDDKGNFNPEATITRAEMAKIIYVILNYGEDDKAVNYTGAKIFSDVEAGAWYEGYINYAATTKLVQGRPDGTFGPNAPITTAEAAKMLLTAIGYSAENRGYVGAGWDKQVLSDASIIGLLKDYNYNTTGYAPRQWVAVMVKNALTEAYTYGTIAPVIFNGLLTGTNLPTTSYQKMGWKYFGLYDWEGIITANEYADLYGDETLSGSNTQIDKGEYKFKNWTTDLTEIGEYRWGYAVEDGSKDKVVYVGGADENTEFSTGDAVSSISTKSNIDGIKVNDSTEYYKNFAEAKKFNATENGDWLRVVDNDEDGYAEYVFATEFQMTEVTKVAKDDTVFLANGEDSDEFEMSAEVAKGDIVLYTKIDKVEYVELAPSFTGKVEKYTYKTETLTVGGEDYDQSYIDVDADTLAKYYDKLETAARKTEYVYYLDFFNNIRLYGRDKVVGGELVLLTDAYYETNRGGDTGAVDAYLDGEIKDTDACTDTDDTDVDMFINMDDHDNKWGALKAYADSEAKTNVARYELDEDGVIYLYDAETWYYDKKGEPSTIKTDYINLVDEEVEAGETTYNAYESGKQQYVQANKETVFYYVSYAGGLKVKTVTGYKNSYDVIDELDIRAMYAVATNIENDSDADPYWVADVIVIETYEPVFNLGNDVVLGYDIVNKTVKDYANLDVIGADAALDNLNVTSINGYNEFNKGYFTIPAFYFNTEDEEGDSHIREIKADFAKYGIYAINADRVNDLDEYVVAKDAARSIFYYDETTVVYDIDERTSYNRITTVDSYDDALELTTGESYILYTDGDGFIVYAILVENEDDLTAGLFKAIDASAELADGPATEGSTVDFEAEEYAVENGVVYVDPSLTGLAKAEAIEAALIDAGYTDIAGLTSDLSDEITAKKGSITVKFTVADIKQKDASSESYAEAFLTNETKAGIAVGFDFDTNMAIAAEDLTVVLYSKDTAIAKATNVNEIVEDDLISMMFYGHEHESSSWKGNNFTAGEDLVPTAVKYYVNGVEYGEFALTITEAEWAAYVAKVEAAGCGCSECAAQ